MAYILNYWVAIEHHTCLLLYGIDVSCYHHVCRVEGRINAMVVFAFPSYPSSMPCAPSMHLYAYSNTKGCLHLSLSISRRCTQRGKNTCHGIPPITWKASTKAPKTHKTKIMEHWMNAWEVNQAHPKCNKWSRQPTKPRALSIGWMFWRWIKLVQNAPNDLTIVYSFF